MLHFQTFLVEKNIQSARNKKAISHLCNIIEYFHDSINSIKDMIRKNIQTEENFFSFTNDIFEKFNREFEKESINLKGNIISPFSEFNKRTQKKMYEFID